VAGIIVSAPLLGYPTDRVMNPAKKNAVILIGDVLGDLLANSMINVTSLTKDNHNIMRLYSDPLVLPFLGIKMGKSIL